MMWSIVHVNSTPKKKMNYYDQFNGVQSITETRQNNDVTEHIGAVYVKIRTELSWLIG